MGDDDAKSVLSSKKDGPLPRCVCGWKLCRTYQRAFREVDHEIFHGVVKMKFSEYDETHRTLKDAWDQILGTDDDKKEAWKDGVCKYYVARHHFTTNMIKEYLKHKKSWKWTEPLSKDDAIPVMYKLKDDYKVLSSSDEDPPAYLKVPDVPKKIVKERVNQLKASGLLPEDPIADDISVKSNLSTHSALSTYSYNNNSKTKGKTEQLEDLLASLPSPQDKEDKKKSPKKSKSSKKLDSSLHKSEPNLSTDGAGVGSGKKKKKSTTNDSEDDDLAGASNHSNKSAPSSSSRSKRSPKKSKTGSSKVKKKPEDFEGQLLELADKGAESMLQEKISKLQAELFEKTSIAESALEDLEESKRECYKLREVIRNMNVQVGQVSGVLDGGNVDEMEKLQLSSTSTAEDQETKIQHLEEQLRQEKIKTRKLEMEKLKIAAAKSKCDGISSRRLLFLEEMENKLQREEQKTIEIEREYRDKIAEEKSKSVKAIMEAKYKAEPLEKEMGKITGNRGGDGGGIDDAMRTAELEAEIENLKLKNRKLVVAASSEDVKEAMEELQNEKRKLEEQNTNQKKVIQALEGKVRKDDEAMMEHAQKEDDLERGTALLANLYFSQKHADLLKEATEEITLPVPDEEKLPNGEEPEQADLLASAMARKQANWWTTLDGLMGKSGYVKRPGTIE